MIEVRTLSYLLHPPQLDGIGLDVALRAYLEGFSKRTGITVDAEFPAEDVRMSNPVELVVFRVIQEALTNVWRHSGSETARIRLVHDTSAGKRKLTLTIEDFGKGIPLEIQDSTIAWAKGYNAIGLGLAGMRERLHQVGGSLEIQSTTGNTLIRATVPMSAPTSAQ
jgi:signal transduction histidine kinase